MSTNNEQLYFYKGLEANLPTTGIKVGALYHCTDTKNTYRGISETELVIFSTASGQQSENNATVIGTGTATGTSATVIGDGVATGDYAVAMGKDTVAGCMGCYIAAIDPANNDIYLHTPNIDQHCSKNANGVVIPTWNGDPNDFYDVEFENEYIIYTEDELNDNPYGNEFSVSADGYYHWPFAGNIIAISKNKITYQSDTLNSSEKWLSNVPRYLFV